MHLGRDRVPAKGKWARAGTLNGYGMSRARRSASGDDVRHPDNKKVDQVRTLIDRISPILHGQDRQVQRRSPRGSARQVACHITSLMIGSSQFRCVAGYSTSI
jgi:hypothetical protein